MTDNAPFEAEEVPPSDRALHDLARRLLHESAEAEDLVQDTWLAALEKPPRRREGLKQWLSAVLRNLAVNVRRRRGRRAVAEREAARDEHVASPIDAVEIELARRSVIRALAKLREPYQTTLRLMFYEGLSARAIARRERIPIETVRTRVKRGLALVRLDLERMHGGRAQWSLMILARVDPGPPPAARIRMREPAVVVAGVGSVVCIAWMLSVWHPPDRIGAADRATSRGSAELAAAAAPTESPRATREPMTPPRTQVEILREDDRAPVRGALVRVASAGAEARAVTDELGRADFALSRSGAWELDVERTRTTTKKHASLAAAVDAPRDLVETVLVPRAYSLALRVDDEVLGPVSGARVLAWESTAPLRTAAGLPSATVEALTDSTGRAVLDGVRGIVFVHAVDGARQSTEVVRVDVDRDLDLSRTSSLVLAEARTLVGRVLDRDGRPIPGATVDLRGAGSALGSTENRPLASPGAYAIMQLAAQSTADRDGAYALAGVNPSYALLAASAPGHVRAVRVVNSKEARDGLDFALARSPSLDVAVSDASGAPVERARVTLACDASTYERRTDERGRSAFADVAYVGPAFVRVVAAGHAPEWTRVELGPADHAAIEVRLARARSVRGALADRDGSAIPDAEIEWFSTRAIDGERAPNALAKLAEVRTDAAGRFVVPDLPDAGVECEVEIAGPRAATRRFTVADGAEEIALSLAESGAGTTTLRGRVFDARTNQPLESGAEVRALRKSTGASLGSIAVDARGEYELVVADEPLRLAAGASGRVPRFVEIDDPREVELVDFELHASCELALCVTDARGAPVAGAIVLPTDASGAPLCVEKRPGVAKNRVKTADDGMVFLRGLPATHVTVAVHPRGLWTPRTRTFELEPGSRTRVDWRLDDLDPSAAVAEVEIALFAGAIGGAAAADSSGLSSEASATSAVASGPFRGACRVEVRDADGAVVLAWSVLARERIARLNPEQDEIGVHTTQNGAVRAIQVLDGATEEWSAQTILPGFAGTEPRFVVHLAEGRYEVVVSGDGLRAMARGFEARRDRAVSLSLVLALVPGEGAVERSGR